MSDVGISDTNLSPRREAPRELTAPGAKARPPSVTIGRGVAEVFAFVRDFGNYAKFVRGLAEVEVLDHGRAELTFANESGIYQGQIETVDEVTNESVRWRTVDEGGGEPSYGMFTVESAPGARGTVVSLKMHFDDRATPGKVRGMLQYFLGQDPKTESYINLRRLKAYLETGEVPTTVGQPTGRDQ